MSQGIFYGPSIQYGRLKARGAMIILTDLLARVFWTEGSGSRT